MLQQYFCKASLSAKPEVRPVELKIVEIEISNPLRTEGSPVLYSATCKAYFVFLLTYFF